MCVCVLTFYSCGLQAINDKIAAMRLLSANSAKTADIAELLLERNDFYFNQNWELRKEIKAMQDAHLQEVRGCACVRACAYCSLECCAGVFE